ncbi:ComF family protein [uncultured Shimia sp.]|uniref:ComF family protein n=1 Tax=uncultured Shimia sp. TaxID=573152 RepID=UPI0025D4A11B|nr:ComF family protein [uncultured Shimia sp.]
MKAKIQTAIHLLFPPRCVACGHMVESDFGLCADCWAQTAFIGAAVCDVCGRPVTADTAEIRVACDDCLSDPPPWKQGRSAFLYEATGRQIVLAFKHGDRTEIARPAGRWLFNAAQSLLDKVDVIAPVPLHRFRYLRRRFNQAALLAERLAGEAGGTFCPDLLLRTKGFGSLEGLNRVERARKLKGAIEPNPKRASLLSGAKVLLVDDVLTSGVTLRVATDACLTANAKEVSVVTLARVAKHA